jgi:hypothetical protein
MTTQVTAVTEIGGRVFTVRPDSFYVLRQDGVWLRNNHGSFTVRGTGTYDLVRALFAGLDGTRTVDQVCAGANDQVRAATHRLVEALERHAFLKELRSPPETAPPWAQQLYPESLTFLDYWVERPVSRFLDIRSAPVACAGQGPLLAALVGGLGDLGVARLTVATPDPGSVADVVAGATARDPRREWNVTHVDSEAPGAWVDAPATSEARCLLLATEADDLRAVADAERTARRRGQAVGVIARVGRRVVATPLGTADDDWCWECIGRAVVHGEPWSPAPAPAMLAAFQLAQRVFCHLAGEPVPEDRHVTTVDLLTPTVRSHDPRPHPLCGVHAPEPSPDLPETAPTWDMVRADVPDPLDSREVSAVHDRIVTVTSAWTDPLMGPLLAVTEGTHDQVRLSASTCIVRTPDDEAGDSGSHAVTCLAIAPREARNQAVLSALEWLAARTALARGDHDEALVYGAGWTVSEAVYRALARSAQAVHEGVPDTSWQPSEADARAETDRRRRFLAGVLAGDRRRWESTAVETLDSGLVRAFVRTHSGDVACGVGIDRGTAVDHALMTLIGSLHPPGETGEVVVGHPAPPAGTWADVVAMLDDQAVDRPKLTNAGHLLPFLGDDAVLVGVPRHGASA